MQSTSLIVVVAYQLAKLATSYNIITTNKMRTENQQQETEKTDLEAQVRKGIRNTKK